MARQEALIRRNKQEDEVIIISKGSNTITDSRI